MSRSCSKCGKTGHNKRSCMQKTTYTPPTHGDIYTYLVDNENNSIPNSHINLSRVSSIDIVKKKMKTQRPIHCDACTFCFESFTETNKFIGICGHQFHATCMVTNLQYSNKCPICCDNVV